MKEKIHPKVYKAKITCACGNQVELLSTKGETVHVEICSACHPFFTGKQRFLDTAGRIDRFRKKYANLTKYRAGLLRSLYASRVARPPGGLRVPSLFFVLPRSPQVNQSGTAPGTHVQGVTFRGLSMSTRTGRPAATSVSSARSGKRFPMSLGRLLPFLAPAPLVGGQAVMEGVMMRNGDVYALAVRTADGNISVENRPWFSLTRSELLKKPFLRGFPTLIETLVNGIKALNLSAERSTEGTGEELKDWQLVLTLIVSLLFAVGLFVVVPHLLSIIMNWIGLGGDVEGFSFHIWDGLFKFLIFIGYIVGIAFLPDIRRVFCYHGAEHKTIHAYESGDTVTPESAIRFSRLHPRCGTTFLLFVMSIAILLHTVLVPLLLLVWTPDSAVAKHLFTIAFKLLLMVPISALSYELIRYAARLGDGFWGRILRAPGMFLQLLTTREPELDQVEVAVAALASAVGQHPPRLETPPTCNRSH